MVATPQMSFTEAIKTVLVKKYFCFDGRARRSEYWWFVLAYDIIEIICLCLQSVDQTAGLVVSAIVGLLILIPTWGVAVRRLHDIGKSGWCILIGVIPIVGIFILLYWSVKDSDPKYNEYGPSPKYIEEE